MSNKKQNILIVLGLIVLIALIGAVSYAFFNYTRTGSANIVRTGNITFSSDYESINISNVFPIDKANVASDTTNVMTVNVNIEGSTTYEKGVYYEVKAEDVNLTVNGKNVPIGINVTSSNLSNVTLTSYEDGKILTNNSLFAEGRILKSDPDNNIDNSVDGTITIKAYLDRSKIAITDTIEDGNIIVTGYNNGTTNGWINGRVVLTTEEWNSLSSTPLSFRVKVEAIENDVATLVDGPTFIGKVKKLANPDLDTSVSNWQYGEDNNITTFEKVTEKPDTTDFNEWNIISTEDSAYPIYAWYENGVIKYYSESENIKAHRNMNGVFMNLLALADIGSLANLNTTNVNNMNSLFSGCTGITSLEPLSNWNVSNVTNMNQMFFECIGLTSLTSLSNWNVSNVTDMYQMFALCTGLTSLDGLSNWNVLNVTDMQNMFRECTGITSLNGLFNWNVSNVTTMKAMFYNCTGLTSLDGLSKWNVLNVNDMRSMFQSCTGILNLNPISNWNVLNVTKMREMFRECTALSDASGINDWNITSVSNFNYMFNNAPSHPEFTKRAGTWNNGTFTPSA